MRHRSLLLVSFALAIAVLAGAAVAKPTPKVAIARDGWPNTRKGEIARGWVNAFSTGDSAMTAFYTRFMAPKSLAQRTMSQRLQRYHEMREKLGTLTLATLGDSTASDLNAKLMSADAAQHDFTFTIETQPPYQLLSVSMKEFRPHFGFMHH